MCHLDVYSYTNTHTHTDTTPTTPLQTCMRLLHFARARQPQTDDSLRYLFFFFFQEVSASVKLERFFPYLLTYSQIHKR